MLSNQVTFESKLAPIPTLTFAAFNLSTTIRDIQDFPNLPLLRKFIHASPRCFVVRLMISMLICSQQELATVLSFEYMKRKMYHLPSALKFNLNIAHFSVHLRFSDVAGVNITALVARSDASDRVVPTTMK